MEVAQANHLAPPSACSADALALVLPETLAQQVFLNLAGRRARQSGDELDALWAFEMRQILAAKSESQRNACHISYHSGRKRVLAKNGKNYSSIKTACFNCGYYIVKGVYIRLISSFYPWKIKDYGVVNFGHLLNDAVCH